ALRGVLGLWSRGRPDGTTNVHDGEAALAEVVGQPCGVDQHLRSGARGTHRGFSPVAGCPTRPWAARQKHRLDNALSIGRCLRKDRGSADPAENRAKTSVDDPWARSVS